MTGFVQPVIRNPEPRPPGFGVPKSATVKLAGEPAFKTFDFRVHKSLLTNSICQEALMYPFKAPTSFQIILYSCYSIRFCQNGLEKALGYLRVGHFLNFYTVTNHAYCIHQEIYGIQTLTGVVMHGAFSFL